jgi:hypothetical protein
MKSILIFCPDITGHRHLYCRRFIEYFRSRNVQVTLATAGRWCGAEKLGKPLFEETIDKTLLHVFNHDDVEYINLQNYGHECVGSIKQGIHLCKSRDINHMFHVDADLYRLPLSLGEGSEDGISHHLVLIITEFIDLVDQISFEKEVLNGFRALRHKKRRNQILGSRLDVVEKFPRLSRKIIERLAKRKDIKSIISTDERIGQILPLNISLILPEIGSSRWELEVSEPPDEFSHRVINQVENFLLSHPFKKVFSMLGDLEKRKGYDMLLGICAEDPDAVCIRIGRTKPNYTSDWFSVENKETLIQEDRLLEVDSYVASWKVFDRVLSSQTISVLPYRNFYRTSGMFVDSLLSGLPVVVPEKGLMGHRVQTLGLGTTFRNGDLPDLRRAVDVCYRNKDDYMENVTRFSKTLERKHIYSRLDELFGL